MISHIELKDFRSFDHLSLDTNTSLVILSGKNAVGKTTILESIYLCSTSKSHRTNDLKSLISTNKDFSVCEISAKEKYKMVISNEGKSLYINQKEISKISEFIGNLNVVMFSPEDLRLITGGKLVRRRFLDLEISLLNKSYLRHSSIYKRVLKERNELLKTQPVDETYFSIVTRQLVESLEEIYKGRMEFISKINEILKGICVEMKIEEIQLEYKKTYGDDVLSSFEAKKRLDFMNRTTNIGTHRDDFEIWIDHMPASVYASEGQIRTICIALKLAVKEYITQYTNREPILLLDDVFASLDKNRIETLTSYVLRNHQTFITTTSILEVPDSLLKSARVIRIEKQKEKQHGRN